jgi:dUTP pyrophosphatase
VKYPKNREGLNFMTGFPLMDAHDRRGSASIDNPDSHELRCKRLSNDAILPTRTHDTDAGWDLYSSGDQFIMPGRWGLVDTGISMEIPKGYAGLIWPRSGLAVKKGVDVFAGVIDSGYRGEIKVCLFNSSNLHVEIQKGDRVAQILFQEVPKITMVEVEDLNGSKRGVGGFGSSGS